MGGTDTAASAGVKPHEQAVGMAIAGVVATILAVVVLPITLVVVVIVRSQEIVPWLIQAVARRLPKRGLR